jgi:hypothetical protein
MAPSFLWSPSSPSGARAPQSLCVQGRQDVTTASDFSRGKRRATCAFQRGRRRAPWTGAEEHSPAIPSPSRSVTTGVEWPERSRSPAPDCLLRRAGLSCPAVAGFCSVAARNCHFITVSPSERKDFAGYVLRTVCQYLNSYGFSFLTSRDIIKFKLFGQNLPGRKRKKKTYGNRNFSTFEIRSKRFHPALPMSPRIDT